MIAALKSRLRGCAAGLSFALLVTLAVPAAAGATVLQLSADPFTQATCAGSTLTNHHTEVEPDTVLERLDDRLGLPGRPRL